MDVRAIEEGEDHDKLDDTFVIMLTEKDYWKTGEDFVEFCTYSEQLGRRVEDGRHIVYVNGEAKGDSAIARLMHDFRCADPENMHYTEIRKGMEKLKNSKEATDSMGYNIDDFIEEGIEEGIVKGKAEMIVKLHEENVPLDTISRCAGMSIEEVEKILAAG